MNFPVFQRAIRTPLQWCVILIGLFVPVSVVLDNLMFALILLGALFSLGSISRVVRSHPVARAAILLFLALFIAMFYGSTPLKEAFVILMKYIDLMFVPIFIFLLSNEIVQRRARYAFIAAMALTLLFSYLIGLQVVPVMPWMNPWTVSDNPAIFHSHITQNNMMAFAIFLSLLECREAITRGKKIAWAVFAVLGIINVLFMVQGRTGYLILLTLAGWFAWTTFARAMRKHGRSLGWRQKGLVALSVLVVAFVAYNSSARLHDRMAKGIAEYQAWTPDHGRTTSIGQRLDFYSNTLQIVSDHPLQGVGTGGFVDAFAKQAEGKDIRETRNPHNEYLMISVQTGIVGLALLLYLFYTQWRYAPLLVTPFEQDAARGLVLMYLLSCMINSALMDHADGLLFSFMTAVLFSNLKPKLKND